MGINPRETNAQGDRLDWLENKGKYRGTFFFISSEKGS